MREECFGGVLFTMLCYDFTVQVALNTPQQRASPCSGSEIRLRVFNDFLWVFPSVVIGRIAWAT